MAVELNNRTKIMAGVAVLALAGAGAWFFYFQGDAVPPPAAAPAKPAAKAAANAAKSAPADAAKPAADAPHWADAAKPAAEAPKQAAAPKPAAEDSKQAAAASPVAAPAAPTTVAAAKPAAAKPIPRDPDQLIAEVIETSGLKSHFQTFGREAMLKAGAGGPEQQQGASPDDVRAVTEIVGRVFEPGKMTAELAANLKAAGNFDVERMARFLELLRRPIALKMNSQEMRSVTPEAMKEFSENFRKSPPPAARMKLIRSIDEVTHTSEVAADMTNAMARNMVDAMLDSMQKAGKRVPREARQMVGSQLNSMRNQMRSQFRTIMYVMYRDATDQELSEYLKLLDADTGRWGSELLTNAIRPILVSRGSTLGRENAQLAMAKQAVAKQAVAKAPASPPAAKAEEEKPVAVVTPAPVEQPGYRRPANIRDVYTHYNDVISATVMRDGTAVKELLDDGKSPNSRQKDGLTPLMIAASNGDADIAAMLLAKGADPTLRAPGGRSALSIAKARGAAGAEMVQMLERSGVRD
jgi:Ankyrin repeats (many copies)